MRIIIILSDYIMPMMIGTIIVIALIRKVEVMDAFIEGAKDGFKVVLEILPTIIGLMMAVGVLRASGFLELLTEILKPIAKRIAFPEALIPITLMRTVSSSAATGLVLDLFKNYGPDSLVGRMASIMMGCTETVFYTMSVYFMAANVKKTRYTLAGALFVTIVGIAVSAWLTYYIF